MIKVTKLTLLIFLPLVIFYVLGTLRPPVDPHQILQSPSLQHWLGTDALGRDMLLRSTAAVAYSLGASMGVLIFSTIAGVILSAISALNLGSLLDRFIILIAETLRSFPTILFVLLFALVGIPWYVLISLYFWIPVWRALRGEMASHGTKAYAEFIALCGVPRHKIMLREVLRNVTPQVIPYSAGIVSDIISLQCAIEFLGFGPSLEQPSLGGVLLEATQLGMSAPWVWLPSLILILILIWITSIIGRHYRKKVKWVLLG